MRMLFSDIAVFLTHILLVSWSRRKIGGVTGKGDGVTNLDALMIQRYEAGLVTKLPVN